MTADVETADATHNEDTGAAVARSRENGDAALARPERLIRRMLRRSRKWVSQHPRVEVGYRVGVGMFGGSIALVGLILVPLPGPGWLIVFLGLAVLGTEFFWARRIAALLKRQLDRFWTWWRDRKI